MPRRARRSSRRRDGQSSLHVDLSGPKAACDTVYATSGYSTSITNLSRISLASDMVFSDGASLELATMSGDLSGGLTAALTVAV